jgi:hypothetical protein
MDWESASHHSIDEPQLEIANSIEREIGPEHPLPLACPASCATRWFSSWRCCCLSRSRRRPDLTPPRPLAGRLGISPSGLTSRAFRSVRLQASYIWPLGTEHWEFPQVGREPRKPAGRHAVKVVAPATNSPLGSTSQWRAATIYFF